MTEIKRPLLKLKIPIKVNPPQGLSKPAEVVKEPEVSLPPSTVVAKPKVLSPAKATQATAATPSAPRASPTKSVSQKIAAPPKKITVMPREEFNSMLKQVCEKYPKLFAPSDGKVRILAIKVHREVQEGLGWSGKKTRKFFHIFCGSKKYKSARIKGANRYDLQGKIVGKVE